MNGKIASREYGWKGPEASHCHSYIKEKICELLPDGKISILDAGCGNGYLVGVLKTAGHEVVGIDVSSDGIEIAKKEYPDVQFETRSVYDDLSDLAFDVDAVISSEVIEHLYSPQSFLENIYSAMKPGAVLILTTPYHGWLKNTLISLLGKWDEHHTVAWEGGHIKFFSQKTLSAMLISVGFRNIVFHNAGRVQWLWKSMVCRAEKPL
jgi:SAM-dependent methyltransferase